MNLYAVFAHQINEVWEKVLPLVNSSLEYADGKWTAESIKTALENKQMQLFIVGKDVTAIAITQVQQYPAKKVLVVMFCAGSGMNDWVSLMSEFEDWAKEQDCKAVEVIGRPGWERVLGWERIHVVVRKTLT